MSERICNDDYCDIYKNKICDNCGYCLEKDGVDIRAINIEDIAKTIDENKYLESEYLSSIENEKKQDEEQMFSVDEYFDMQDINEEYIDAFENIEYIEDLEEQDIDEVTSEIYPGVRKMK